MGLGEVGRKPKPAKWRHAAMPVRHGLTPETVIAALEHAEGIRGTQHGGTRMSLRPLNRSNRRHLTPGIP